jgi:hypothetical protein
MARAIEAVWSELLQAGQRPAFRRIDELHPLDLYAGIDVKDARILMLVTPEQPPPPPAYDVITVASRRRADGNWTLLIELAGDELAIPFARLCQDLIDASRACQSGGAAFLVRRLARWRRLLDLTKSRTLAEPVLRGLLGELVLLKTILLPRLGTASIAGWVGPHGAPQDFVMAGIAIEVKTTAPGTTEVSISSLDQLDTSPLFLVLVGLMPAIGTQPDAFTPAELVQSIRDQLGDGTPAHAEFDLRLQEAGYEDLPEYATGSYLSDGLRYYRVDGAFPRLTRPQVPQGISDAVYQLQITALAAHACQENDLWN